ncbi:hypothetical protein M3Y98_00094900 [Aphelenchoides besseyi]|nr:hypothetical protein M3Y98_00094900 [Aphelenchoides besseyi]
MEHCWIKNASALVGFGPGENNIVSQLYARNLIPFPIIHIVLPSLYLRNGLLKIGDYGYDTCVNWTHHATQHYNRWVLEVRNLEVNGVQYKKQVKALITNHIKSISLPSDFVNELVKTNVLKRFNDTESVIFDSDFYFECDQTLELRMFTDDRLLIIPNYFLNETRIDENRCLPLFDQTDLLRYNKGVEMIIGWTFINQYCVSFDYDQMIIRLAEHLQCEYSLC